MAQHRGANSFQNPSFEDNNVNILAREDKLFERGVKEAISVKLEQPL